MTLKAYSSNHYHDVSAKQIFNQSYFQILSGPKILIVDDSKDALYLYGYILTYAGACVFLANSASAAWQFLDNDQPDIIISDIAMADQNGIQFIKSLRVKEVDAKMGSVPAIAVTGMNSPLVKKMICNSGFQDYLLKPIVAENLVKSILKLLSPSGRYLH